jgi:hypothetical protein
MSYELTTRIRDFPSSGCPEFGFIYGSSRNFLLLHSSRFDAQNPDPIMPIGPSVPNAFRFHHLLSYTG